jgi:RNA polymerase sigma-70 factor (ECF subfamily)
LNASGSRPELRLIVARHTKKVTEGCRPEIKGYNGRVFDLRNLCQAVTKRPGGPNGELLTQVIGRIGSGGIPTGMASRVVSHTSTVESIGSSESQFLDTNDKMLLDCLRTGEDRCYETFVRRYGPQVLATAKRYLRSEADAADCFQDTFLVIFEGVNKFEQRSSFAAWVRGITINQCLMRIRSQARRHEEPIEHLLPQFDETGNRTETADANRSSAIGESIDALRMKSIVREKINELPDDYRIVLLLRDIDGYSTNETAAILRIKVNAVKTRLHRARSALRTLLQPILEHLN